MRVAQKGRGPTKAVAGRYLVARHRLSWPSASGDPPHAEQKLLKDHAFQKEPLFCDPQGRISKKPLLQGFVDRLCHGGTSRNVQSGLGTVVLHGPQVDIAVSDRQLPALPNVQHAVTLYEKIPPDAKRAPSPLVTIKASLLPLMRLRGIPIVARCAQAKRAAVVISDSTCSEQVDRMRIAVSSSHVG